MLRYKTETRPGLVALYDIRPGNGAGQFLQPRSPHGLTGAIRRAKLQSNRYHQQTNTQCFTGRMPFLENITQDSFKHTAVITMNKHYDQHATDISNWQNWPNMSADGRTGVDVMSLSVLAASKSSSSRRNSSSSICSVDTTGCDIVCDITSLSSNALHNNTQYTHITGKYAGCSCVNCVHMSTCHPALTKRWR